MSKTPKDYDLVRDPEMRELLFGEGGPLDRSPPVTPMLKKWTGSPRFHLDRTARSVATDKETAA